MARLTDDLVLAAAIAEMDDTAAYGGNELENERATAMDYYLGEPYGDESEDRSSIRTREVLETVESVVPSLVRIFADADNMCEFRPAGPEDEDAAQQESDRVNDVFWNDNEGFYNLSVMIRDAVLSKTGILKCWWDDSESEEREEYRGLNEFELSSLMNEEGVEREVLEFDQGPAGVDVTFKAKRKTGKVRIEPVPPEEFGISRTARSPYPSEAVACWHRSLKTYSDLIEMGYSRELVDSLPFDYGAGSTERNARRNLENETDQLRTALDESMREYWVAEVYLKIDRDDDGIAELVRVRMVVGSAGTASGAALLDITDVDAVPFFAAPPILRSHAFYGISLADLTLSDQRIKSTLMRLILDNSYLAVNLRTHINDRVEEADMLTRRPGGIVRHDGDTNPAANMSPEPFYPLPDHVFPLLEYLDKERKDRIGVGDQVPGLDAMSLANVNTGVAAMAYDQARMRIELVARTMAEVALKPLLRHIHELLIKHQSKAEVVRMRGKWIQIDPSQWRHRSDMTVRVGLGLASRERRLMALDALMAKQGEVVQSGGMGVLLGPQHIYKSLHDWSEAWGLEPGAYWQDPAELPPQQPEGPSIQEQALMAQAQAQLMAAQAAKDRNQVEVVKAQIGERVQAAQAQATMREAEAKRALEGMRGQLDLLKAEAQRESATGKAALEAEVKRHQMQIEAAEMRLKDQQEQDKREVELYRALLQSGTQLTQEQMRMTGAENGGAAGLFSDLQAQTGDAIRQVASELAEAMRAELGEVKAQILEDREARKAPRAIKRDKQGLIIAIGDSPVARDESGKVVQIG